jgi:hypothetical protein
MNSIERGGPLAGRRTGAVLVSFLYVCSMVGFLAGTAVVLGPMRWVGSAAESTGWGEPAEDLILGGVIVGSLVVSVLISRWLVRRIYRSDSRQVRFGIPMLVTLVAALSLWAG